MAIANSKKLAYVNYQTVTVNGAKVVLLPQNKLSNNALLASIKQKVKLAKDV